MNEHPEHEQEARQTGHDGQFSKGVDFLFKVMKAVFIGLAICISAMILYFLVVGGSFRVDTTKEAVIVLRFGKLDPTKTSLYTEGWHWFMPYPINKIIRIPTRIEKITCDTFMPANKESLSNKPNPETGPPSGGLTPGRDGYLLILAGAMEQESAIDKSVEASDSETIKEAVTEIASITAEKEWDLNAVHASWDMNYKVSDPIKFFTNCISRETSSYSKSLAKGSDEDIVTLDKVNTLLRNLIEDAVVCTSAGRDIWNTYYKRTDYESAVRSNLIKSIEKLDIGITLENLSLKLVSPPASTREAFQMLQLSMATAAKLQEEARTYSVEQENLAKTESAQIVSNAENYKKRVVTEVLADTDYFKQILTEYRKNPEATFVFLYSRKLADAMATVENKFFINLAKDTNQEVRIKLNPEPEIKKSDILGGGVK